MTDGPKTAKACEPCRRRKVKCNGQTPCLGCQRQPSNCKYRFRTRVRPRRLPPQQANAAVSLSVPEEEVSTPSRPRPPAAVPVATVDGGQSPSPHDPHHQVYDMVAAVRDAPQAADCSQLYYGPSSNFALLQHLYRQILAQRRQDPPCSPPRPRDDGATQDHHDRRRKTQEARLGLETFFQTAVFFGVPLQCAPLSLAALGDLNRFSIARLASKEVVLSFLENFKLASLDIHPFLSARTLDRVAEAMYVAGGTEATVHPQTRVVFLVAVAIGALSTPCSKLADQIYLQARQEASLYSEVVTLPMIQFSVLAADYQMNMGRPNDSYLHIGAACRKGLASGLHSTISSSDYAAKQERHATLWSMYFMEMWLSLRIGRMSCIRHKDVRCPYPDGQPLLASLCSLAAILEDVADLIYWHKTDSIQELYETCQTLYRRAEQFGKDHAIGSTAIPRDAPSSRILGMLTLHNVYYQLVHTIFRPFLIASPALEKSSNTGGAEGDWFRHACRNAMNAAIDSIVFTDSILRVINPTKVRRCESFVIEASCSVLLHDSLLHQLHQTDNLVYIQMALKCLRSMINEQPVSSVARSIQKILTIVQDSTLPQDDLTAPLSSSLAPPQLFGHLQILTDTELLDGGTTAVPFSGSSEQQTSAAWPSSNLGSDLEPGPQSQDLAWWMQSTYPVDFDVLTTDLFNFFPSDTR